MQIKANVCLEYSSYGGFNWSMSNFYCTWILHFKHNALLNGENTCFVVVAYATI